MSGPTQKGSSQPASGTNSPKKKRRTGRRILVLLLALLVFYLLGPRVSVEEIVLRDPTSLPELGQLDQFLEEKENVFKDDLVEETRKTIFWNDASKKERTPFSVVYLHGFSGSHCTMAPLPQQVAEELGANLFCTRYAGHGRKDATGYGEALGEASLQDWVDDTREALAIGRKLGGRLVVIANSTAAPLLTWVVGEGGRDDELAPDLLVLMSPNFGLDDLRSEVLLGPWGRQILGLTMSEKHSVKNIEGEDHRRLATTQYPSRAILTMMKAVKLGRSSRFDRIMIPALCLYSKEDQVVDPQKALSYFGRLAGKSNRIEEVKSVKSEDSHVLAGDLLSKDSTDEVRKSIVDFVRNAFP